MSTRHIDRSRRRPSRLVTIVRGLAALLVLGAVGIGVPLALVRFVGSPFPSADFAVSRMLDDFRRTGISESTVTKALALVVWFAWARLLLGFVVELGSQVSHRPVASLRILGSSQRLAGHLITAVVLMVSSFSGIRGVGAAPMITASPASPIAATPLARSIVARHLGAENAELEQSRAPRPMSTVGTWTVQRNDSFWEIAEATLGDGMRWREVVAANLGREVSPGVVFTESTEAIHPGWVLALPGGSASASQSRGPTAPTAPAATGRQAVVERGDTLSEIAEAEFGDSAAWPALWEANQGRVFGDRVFDDPNTILPGWQLVVPDDPQSSTLLPAAGPLEQPAVDTAEAGSGVSMNGDIRDSIPEASTRPTSALPTASEAAMPVVETSVPMTSASAARSSRGLDPFVESARRDADPCPVGGSPTTSGAALPSRADNSSQMSVLPAGVAGVAGSLFAGGALALIAARRRGQLRRAPRGATASPVPTELISVARALTEVSSPERLARLDAALRAAAAQLVERSERCAVVAALVDASGTLELAVFPPTSSGPRPPFIGDGTRWLLPEDVPTSAIAPQARRFAAFPNPAIVQIGHSAGCDVFIDLEAIGLLTIDGGGASEILRVVTAGLAVSPFAELARLVVLDADAGPVVGRGEHLEDLDAALDLAADAVSPILAQLGADETSAMLRIRSSGEPWEPMVLAIGAGFLSSDHIGTLAELSQPAGRGLGIVTDASAADAAWCLVETPSGWVLDPLGWAIEPCGLPRAAARAVRDLIDHASEPLAAGAGTPGIGAAASPVTGGAASPPENPPGPGGHLGGEPTELPRLAEWTLLIRVLGPIDAVDAGGNAAHFEKSKSLELLAWLTEHRQTATRTGARGALWGNDVRDATFANVVSDARRGLARLCPVGAGDEEWLGRTLTERLVLHPLVRSDLDVLREAINQAKGRNDGSAIAILRPAVELIRGVPFSGVAYLWADTEAVASNAALLAITAAAEMAERLLRLGDVDGVLWATSQGLLALPGHEELVALRLRAHGCRQDIVGLRQEWDQYERVLDADPWLDSEPSPSLIELRNSLIADLRGR